MGCQASKTTAAGAHTTISELPPCLTLTLSDRDVAHGAADAGKKSKAKAYASNTPAITPQADTAPPSVKSYTCRDQRSSSEISTEAEERGSGGAEQTGACKECGCRGMFLQEQT